MDQRIGNRSWVHNPASNNKRSHSMYNEVKLTCYYMNTVCLRPTVGAIGGN